MPASRRIERLWAALGLTPGDLSRLRPAGATIARRRTVIAALLASPDFRCSTVARVAEVVAAGEQLENQAGNAADGVDPEEAHSAVTTAGALGVRARPGYTASTSRKNETLGNAMAELARSGGVQSVGRVLDLLELVAGAGGEIGLSELAERSGLPLPSIHRLVRTLVDRGYMRQLPNRRYALGARLIPLGRVAGTMLGSWARPVLTALVDALGESANLAVLDDDAVMYIGQVSSRHSVRMFTEVGRRVYAHCSGVGKALLSQLPTDAVRELLARTGMPSQTPNTITDPDELIAELAQIRRHGYALDEGEQEVGVRCVAVPVLGALTPLAISVSGPAPRMTEELVAGAVPLLNRAAQRLSAEILLPGGVASV